MMRGGQREEPRSCLTAMVAAVGSSWAVTALATVPCQSTALQQIETGEGMVLPQARYHSSRPASLLAKNPIGMSPLLPWEETGTKMKCHLWVTQA